MLALRWVLLTLVITCASFAPALDDKPQAKPTAPAFEVERHKDIAYRTDKEADKVRHKLDVYRPKGQKDFPVVLFVHGGTWKSGNKNLYTVVGETFAKHGIGMVICNYRLSPAVQHPAHVEDVAKAFAWTHENIEKYGGKVENLFVCGHSAGGHLVSLLATDPIYLKAEKKSPEDIRGVVAVSGVYTIAPLALFRSAFGDNAEVCKKASPLTHVTGKLPPFLIAYAETELPSLSDMAKEMHAALKKADNSTELLLCKSRTHSSIISNIAKEEDSLHKALREFVKTKSK